MRLINAGGCRQRNVSLGIDVGPGETCDVADGYVQSGKASNGARAPSIIESICPHLEPQDPAMKALWLAGEPFPAKEAPLPTVQKFVQEGHSVGVAEVLVEQAKVEQVKVQATFKIEDAKVTEEVQVAQTPKRKSKATKGVR